MITQQKNFNFYNVIYCFSVEKSIANNSPVVPPKDDYSNVSTKINEKELYSFVLVGATGDLARREIYPALWELYRDNLLPDKTRIYGFARSNRTISDIRERVQPFVDLRPQDKATYEKFWSVNEYIGGSSNQTIDYETMARLLEDRGGNRLFYLAIPPSGFAETAAQLPRKGPPGSWTRLVIEKPFGRDSESSQQLTEQLARLFEEEQIYRMDHFLGYEMVQNLVALRFANRVLEPVWSREHVAAVEVDFRENLGVEGRGGFFDENGIIRDVVQNHLMQIVTLVAMERPESVHPNDIRDAKEAVLKSIKPVTLSKVVIGQYIGNPESDDPRERIGYRQDPTVPDDSITATFSLTVLDIDNHRWRGVPFIIRAGKGLDTNKTEVVVQFKDVHNNLFNNETMRNEVVIRIKESEALQLKLMSKTPGINTQIEDILMDFDYRKEFNGTDNPGAYKRLILDVFNGSQTNFVRSDELSEAWRIFTPILHELEGKKVQPIEYKFGSTGPSEAVDLEKKFNFIRK
ncbi:glucose-6-phosphate 1-dehydrogenase-like [Copidosoma floridanum]|uniref:glucose-6-phosphate 1-dehydrogenase-like n=1 Tax=Copidosoma floridanum TaxID=29053 RepID=UPI0006C9C4BE|nr:glucose-6-phosphate 1-dehydrogenase-like [Copidosoma floridanum]